MSIDRKSPYLASIGITAFALLVLAARRVYELQDRDLQILLVAAFPWFLISLPHTMRQLRIAEFDAFGLKVKSLEDKLEVQEDKLEVQENKIREQQRVINDIVVFSMAFYLVEMLRDFRRLKAQPNGEYKFRKSTAFESNLRYLRDHGHIEMIQIRPLADGEDILPKIKLTPAGSRFLELRDEYDARPMPS
jgi:hypothetical protein